MSRPLRIEFAGAIYHVTSRGNASAAIFKDDVDRVRFLQTLGLVVERFNWICHAFCLMNNHYHLMIETPDGNLSAGMRQLNGVYTQRFNRRHRRVGHVFQGRFNSILIDRDSYLLEVCRYVVLNPVRARMVRGAGDYPWSSYRATAGLTAAPSLLTCEWVLSQFSQSVRIARRRYRQFVQTGMGNESPWQRLRGQVFLGSEGFVAKLRPVLRQQDTINEIPRRQRFAGRPEIKTLLPMGQLRSKLERDRAIRAAYLKHGYTLSEIGGHLGLHYTTVSKAVNQT